MMKKKGVKFNTNLIYLAIVIIVILMFVFGRKGGEDVDVLEENLGLEERGSSGLEDSAGSGILEIETFPGDAEIFVDGVYSDKSSTTLYNILVGKHSVVIKKSGYEDFTVEVSIEAGKKSFLEARLLLSAVEKEAVTDITEGDVEVIEIVEEEEIVESVEEEAFVEKETLPGISEDVNTVNVGNKFILFYDFSENEFSDKRNFEQDTFSKRYNTYFVFTRINPINIKTINKNFADVKKEDCAGVTGQFEWLYSGQSLCVITKENQIVAVSGEWEDTENAELTWKLFD
jgi:hypothetical protein